MICFVKEMRGILKNKLQMKKHLFIVLLIFFTIDLLAQNQKILGDWKEVYTTKIDTAYEAMEQIKTDPEAYYKGYKKISSKYISYQEVRPDNNQGFLEIRITKDLGLFWLSLYKNDFVKKITYTLDTNRYLITKGSFTRSDLTIEYDEKNQHLLFIDKELGITMYEFSRKL